MSAFELFFSLFGLILGLAIAAVAGGMSDVLRERNRIHIGLLTPVLVAFLLTDLTSFWVTSWRGLRNIGVGFPSMLWAMATAAIYFFSATAALPKKPEEWKSLDDYYASYYRWVLGGVLVANLSLLCLAAAVSDRGFFGLLMTAFRPGPNMIYYGVLVAMLIFRNRFLHFAGYAILFAGWAFLIARNPSLR